MLLVIQSDFTNEFDCYNAANVFLCFFFCVSDNSLIVKSIFFKKENLSNKFFHQNNKLLFTLTKEKKIENFIFKQA